MGKWGTGKILRKCEYCRNEFYARHDRKGKYCSRSCGKRANPTASKKIELICKCCGKTYIAKLYRKNISKYCSRKCLSEIRGQNMQKENHHFWKGGITKRSFASRYEIEKKKKEIGNCEKCGSDNNLEGHHIYGYKNDKNSIQILCFECHANEHPKLSKFIKEKYGQRKMDSEDAYEKRGTS